MKKIIICEGKHDGIFLRCLLEKLSFSDEHFTIFDQKNQNKKEKKNAETRELNRFVEKTNQKKLLIKLEGGKHSAIKIFSTNMPYCLENTDSEGLILMLDLDEEHINKRKKVLNEIITGRHQMLDNLEFDHVRENDHFHHLKTKVSQNNTELGKFHIIFFKKSLEHSCNISDEICVVEEKINKIDEFISNKKLTEFFSPIMN